jgi:hypothetical protein
MVCRKGAGEKENFRNIEGTLCKSQTSIPALVPNEWVSFKGKICCYVSMPLNNIFTWKVLGDTQFCHWHTEKSISANTKSLPPQIPRLLLRRMESVEITESWYNTKDNQQLFTRTWKAVGQVKATLV